MSKTSLALRRLGVAGLSAATIGAGLTAFAAAPANAAGPVGPGDPTSVKTVTITPVNTALSTQAEDYNNDDHTSGDSNIGCQLYSINALDASGNEVTDAQLSVILTPSAGVDSEFCDSPRDGSGAVPAGSSFAFDSASNTNGQGAGNPGQPDQATGDTGPGNTGPVTIGINEVTGDSPGGGGAHTAPTAVAGTINITVYADQDGNRQVGGTEPKATGVENIVASPNAVNQAGQDEITNKLVSSPANATFTESSGNHPWTVTTSHDSSLVAGADVKFETKNSQGVIVSSGGCGATANASAADDGASDAMTTCNVPTPAAPTGTSSGPYTITFFTPHASCDAGSTSFVAGCDASTTSTMNTTPPAGANDIVVVTCGGASTLRYGPAGCSEPTSATTETFTGKVTNSTTGAPVAGDLITFHDNSCCNSGTETDSISPLTCVSGADGTCSTTVTLSHAPGAAGNGDEFDIFATLSNGNNSVTQQNQDAYVIFEDNPTFKPTNVDAGPDQSGTTGQTKIVTAQVENQDGSFAYRGVRFPRNNVTVTFTLSGSGTFTNGTTQQSVVVGNNGQAQVAVTSGAAGTSTVTASINPNETDCTVAAGDPTNKPRNDEGDWDPTARAGNCSDTANVTWSKPVVGTHRVVVNLHLSCFSPRKHVVKCVGQLNRPISGVTVVFRNAAGRVVGRAVTNSAGKAKIKLTGLKSHKTHRYHAHARKSARTFPADSNTSTVRVS